MGRFIDMTNWVMSEHGVIDSRVTVIQRYGYDNGKHVTWLCKCSCGKEFVAVGNYLRNGTTKSCGCYRNEVNNSRFKIELTGKQFGFLSVLEELPERTKKGYIQYKCQCKCGNICIVNGQYLRNGDTKSCGCMSSNGEAIIESFLQKHDVIYKKQYTFQDLLSHKGSNLRFDFGIIDSCGNLKCLIEYQGIQHYKDYNKYGKYQRCYSDEMKRNYCKLNNIQLYEITYYDNIDEKLNLILKEI